MDADDDYEEEDPCDLCGSRVLHEECDERDLDDYNAADDEGEEEGEG